MPLASSSLAAKEFHSEDAVQRLVEDRLRQKQGIGLIVGLVDPRGSRFLSAGASGNPARPVVDERTLFEIGSLTKVFTAAALADAIARGTVSLQDPLGKYISLPADGIGDRTLKELVTHTSGLPRLPGGFAWRWNLLWHLRNPYANYSLQALEAHIRRLKGKRLPRGRFVYSNLGAGILGNILAASESTEYADLIAQRVTGPLGMLRTYLSIPQSEKSFVAQPHTQTLRPTPLWTMIALAGAGGMRSCMHDMLRFASAALASTPPLYSSLFQPLAKVGHADSSVGFGWMLRNSAGYQVAWHNGGTGGSRSFLGLDFRSGRAIVAFGNTSHSLDQLGVQLLLGPAVSENFF